MSESEDGDKRPHLPVTESRLVPSNLYVLRLRSATSVELEWMVSYEKLRNVTCLQHQ